MSLAKRLLAVAATLFFAGTLSSFATDQGEQTLKGYVTDTYCGYNRVNQAPTAECTLKCVKNSHAKYAFFNFADKKVYILNPQSEAAKYAGQTVVVQGTVGAEEKFATARGPGSGAVITTASITPVAGK